MEYLVAILVGLLVILYLWKSKRQNLPPGPWGLPIVGYIPFLTSKPYLDLQNLAEKYGNIFSIRLGSIYVVVLDDFQTTKEVFNRDVFMSRPPEFPFQQNEYTLATGAYNGPPWKEQRRLSLHMLRDLGLGKSKMEGYIQEEIEELLEHLQQNSGKPFNPRPILSASMSNNIASLVFGKRLKYDDPIRKAMNEFAEETINVGVQTSFINILPWFKTVCKYLGIGGLNKASDIINKGRAFIMHEILEHEKTLNPENVRDFIDGYLVEMQKRKDNPTFDKRVLQDIAVAFFTAGSETVLTTVEWLSLLMAQYQDHQRRIQAEIDEVVGRNRLPTWQDHLKLPYTTAYIMEMQRWRTLVPLNLMRLALADTEINGYFIPKHTRILNNLWSVHHDKDYWGEDAEDFNPERFLAEDGKIIKKFDRYIPFSVGKRSCPGEPLANMEMFLYFTAIVQRFNITFPDGKQADFDTDLGVTLKPRIQKIILTKRS